MTEPHVLHASFHIERTYRASPARVFAAFSDPNIKRRWFAESEGFGVESFTMDFRVGGLETGRFRLLDGNVPMGNDTVYLDLVPERRIVIAYVMTVGEQRISASLATIELTPSGKGTAFRYTEQGAYFDGAGDGPRLREQGCGELFDKLGAEVDAAT